MFKTAKFAINAVRQIAYLANEERAYRKVRRARLAEENRYDAMIAESQTKIGPYKPATIPVQVWA